jgi:1,4-alpha-glucan branching enzyme
VKTIITYITILFVSFSPFEIAAQNDTSTGYRIDGDDVVFTFDQRDYEKATNEFHGDKIDFDKLTIENVVVAGEFNNWSRQHWKMTKIDNNRYELRKPLSEFTDTFSYEFKFLINNAYWAEPSRKNKNAVDAKDIDGNPLHVYNLRLFTAFPDDSGNMTFKLKGHNNARKVILSGTFNRWDEQAFRMKKTDNGWELTLQLPPGYYEYKYIVDGNWMEDPHNPSKTINEFGGYNSVISMKVPVTFTLKGYSNAKKVILAGSFNDWSEHELQMTKTDAGWTFTTFLNGGKHHYKFIVDGNWMLDPKNSVQEFDGNGHINSVCMVK